ncbi:Uncharacterised protein [Legionella pneumophila]|nr:Uncharacterised protein [Legionella pneumophila]
MIGCGVPAESLAWNNTRALQLAGSAEETSIAHRLPCKSPAYTTVTGSACNPSFCPKATVDNPWGKLTLQAEGTAAQRSIFLSSVPV